MAKYVSFFLLLLFSLFGCDSSPKRENLPFKKQIRIENETKIEVHPRYWIPDRALAVEITLKSTQNPDLIAQNMAGIALLVTEHENPVEPTEWIVSDQSEYETSGTLYFPIKTKPKAISLILFIPEDLLFSWDSKETQN